MHPEALVVPLPRVPARTTWLLPLTYALRILAGGGVRRAIRYMWRAAASPLTTQRWLAYIETGPARAAPIAARLDLAQKIYRPFGRHGQDLAGRIGLLRDHYDGLATRVSAAAIARLASGQPMSLGTLAGRGGRIYELAATRDCRFGKEGEITLTLQTREPEIALAAATLAVGRASDGRLSLSLGGLQGPPRPHGRDEVVAATRDLYGLRPKRVVIAAACALARWLGADGIVAASNANHVSRGLDRRREIRADYDAFWDELGGCRRADGDYDLPVDPPRRCADDLPAKRRKDWLRRTAVIDDLTRQVRRSLDATL